MFGGRRELWSPRRREYRYRIPHMFEMSGTVHECPRIPITQGRLRETKLPTPQPHTLRLRGYGHIRI